MTDKIDTTDEACALVCMIVSNPSGLSRSVGWQKRVNDLIRALRDERNEQAAYIRQLEAAMEEKDEQ